MKLAVVALGIGGAIVGAIELLGRNQVADPVPFFLLLPGVLVGALALYSGFNTEGDMHHWGFRLGTLILYGFNVVFYSGLAYLILRMWFRKRQPSSR